MKNVTYINAGAGSGKTFTLTKILSERLADGSVKPSQVILTTFTELAATEFREKARNRILAGDDHKNGHPKLDEEFSLEAAAQIDSATIGTVHSVALRFVKKFWYLLDYGADIQVISQRDEEFYLNQSLNRIMSDTDDKGNLKRQADLDNFRSFRDYFNINDSFGNPDYQFWQKYLDDVVEKMEYYGVDEIQTSIDENYKMLAEVFNQSIPNIEKIKKALADYRDYCRNLSKNPEDKADRHAKEADRLYAQPEQNRQWWLDIQKLTKEDPVSPKQLAQSEAASSHALLCDTMNNYAASDSHLEVLKPFVESIFNVAKEWREDFVNYKKINRIISYNDMEQLFLHLLENESEVRDYISDHYRLILVDEFQDSNPIQLKIFNQLSELIAINNGHSVWVGDPKQAIYGFRGADTDLVNALSKSFCFYEDAEIHEEEGDNNLGTGRLVESWRSRVKLVELVNDTFYKPFVDYGINELLIKLDPHFKDDKLATDAIEHWECGESNQTKAAAALAVQVEKLLQSKVLVHKGQMDEDPSVITPRDIAILCRKGGPVKTIVKALRQRNIPVSEPEDDILQRIEVQLVIVLLRFIQNPSDKHLLADLMRLLWGKSTEEILKDRIQYVLGLNEGEEDCWHCKVKTDPVEGGDDSSQEVKKETSETDNENEDDVAEETMGDSNEDVAFDMDNSDEDIDVEVEDDEIANDVSRLRKQLSRYRDLSIPEMVRALIYECNLPALTAKWGDQHIRQQNLSTLQHLADDYDQMCLQMGQGSSINGFINYLKSNDPDKEKDNISDTVKVFTYHGAKGLEWPVVILHSLDNDVLEQHDFIRKNIMVVREMELTTDGANNQSTATDPFNKKYYIHFFPFILSSSRSNVPAVVLNNIVKLRIYKPLMNKTISEECRLLYVGMTRAKDKLVTFGYKQKYTWLTNVGVKNPTQDYIWGDLANSDETNNTVDKEKYKPTLTSLTAPEEKNVTACSDKYSMLEKPSSHSVFKKRYLSPSKLKSFDGYNNHEEWKEKGGEIQHRGWGKDYDEIGSCIHDIFAVYQPGQIQQNKDAAIRIIGGYGLTGKLVDYVEGIIGSADWLYEQLQHKYPQRDNDIIQHEYPFQLTLDSGQTLRGEIDLLWFYTDENGKQHCVLVDYKSYQGVSLHNYTQEKLPQLSAYASALKTNNIDVTHALIYYPIHRIVHELK